MFDATNVKGKEDVAFDLQTFQKASKYIPSLYINNVVSNVGNSLSARQEQTNGAASTKEAPSWSTLRLLETDEMDSQLLIDGYISQNETRLSELLYSLSRRVGFIVGTPEVKANTNPFGPSVLMRRYVDLINGEEFSKEGRKLLCKSFDSVVL